MWLQSLPSRISSSRDLRVRGSVTPQSKANVFSWTIQDVGGTYCSSADGSCPAEATALLPPRLQLGLPNLVIPAAVPPLLSAGASYSFRLVVEDGFGQRGYAEVTPPAAFVLRSLLLHRTHRLIGMLSARHLHFLSASSARYQRVICKSSARHHNSSTPSCPRHHFIICSSLHHPPLTGNLHPSSPPHQTTSPRVLAFRLLISNYLLLSCRHTGGDYC